jgi:metal-responsive CopG/Arc/MetJ family transcriptional regulator
MKTAISLPDDLFAEADALAAELGTSRSQLYAAAVREYLARHRPDAVTAALDRVYAAEDGHSDPDVAAAATSALANVEW